MAVVTKKKYTRKDEVREIIKAEDPWEPIGHTPMPEIPDLRNWDMRLMKTYKPFYAPMCDLCCFCTYGKCFGMLYGHVSSRRAWPPCASLFD
jgi:CO dehydrogenase/acetyl-CoA synthase alpha subunit